MNTLQTIFKNQTNILSVYFTAGHPRLNDTEEIVKELEIVQKKLADSKVAMEEYKRQHTVVSFTERQNSVIQKLSSLTNAANNARIQRISIEAQYRKIQEYGTSISKTLISI